MNSFWIDSIKNEQNFEKLNNDIETDVCIIGAGIFGKQRTIRRDADGQKEDGRAWQGAGQPVCRPARRYRQRSVQLNAAAAGKIDQDLPVDERGKARHSVAQLIREENIRLDGKRIKALHLPEQYFADAVRIAVDRSFHSLYCSMRQIISQFPG